MFSEPSILVDPKSKSRKTNIPMAWRSALSSVLLCVSVLFSGCHEVNDDRIPQMPVNIDLSDPGLWNTFGVSGFGISRNFIKDAVPTSPAGFHYSADSRTGFGGVLLIGGMDPYSAQTSAVLAYDLACPVERQPDVRVYIDAAAGYIAVCPVCGSHYDVTMAGGAPLSGPAAAKKRNYGLKRYQCLPTQSGGYMIAP